MPRLMLIFFLTAAVQALPEREHHRFYELGCDVVYAGESRITLKCRDLSDPDNREDIRNELARTFQSHGWPRSNYNFCTDSATGLASLQRKRCTYKAGSGITCANCWSVEPAIPTEPARSPIK